MKQYEHRLPYLFPVYYLLSLLTNQFCVANSINLLITANYDKVMDH